MTGSISLHNDIAMITGIIRAPIKERAGASVSNPDLVPNASGSRVGGRP